MDKKFLKVMIALAVGVLLIGMLGCDAQVVYPFKNQPTLSYIDSRPNITNKTLYTELIAASDYIVCVDVLEGLREEHVVDDGYLRDIMIRCFAQVQVREVLKGDLKKNDVFYVQENGMGSTDETGDIWGGSAKTMCGGPMMEQGNRVVLFLVDSDMTTDSGKPLYEMASQLFGKFFYDADGKYHASISYNENYADYLERDICLDDNEPKTLRDFKKMIAEVQ